MRKPATAARGRVVSPAEAAARHWHVVIVGGGPAATACGLAAVAGGLDVLIVERSRMPRSKLCGCCLSPKALAELGQMGLSAPIKNAAVPLAHVRLVTPRGQTQLPIKGPHAVSRDSLDSTLLGHAVENGCHLLPETTVQSLACHADTAQLTCRTGTDTTEWDPQTDAASPPPQSETVSAACVVLATGLAESVRIRGEHNGLSDRPPTAPTGRIGLGATLPPGAARLQPGELIMAVEPHGYCGVVLLEDGRVDVAAAVDAAAIAQSPPADLLESLLARTGLGPLQLASVRLRGTPPLTHRRRLTEGRLFRVGDAAGYVEPFTGEGIGWALASGRLAGEALARSAATGTIDPTAAARAYQRRYAAELGGGFRRCGLVAKAVRSPRLLEAALGGLRLAPWAAAPLVRLATGSRT